MILKFNMVKYGYGQLLQNTDFHKIVQYQDQLLENIKTDG